MEKITLNNGQEVLNFVPDNQEQCAIVPFNTIQRLAKMLPKASLRDIKQNMINSIEYTDNLENYVELLSNEVSFHKTINLITAYQPEVKAGEYSEALVD